MSTQVNIDVLVVGGGLGGVAAAISAASFGVSVMLVEETNWLGGQLTSQGVCTPDEDAIDGQPVVDIYGSTQSYRDLKHGIREWYRTNATLSTAGQAQTLLNIGMCWVNMGFATEPAVAIQVLESMLTSAGVTPILNATVSGPPMSGRIVGPLTVLQADGTSSVVTAKYILDATETGELLPLFNLPYSIGWEATGDTGEPAVAPAPNVAQPTWIQPVTYPIALIHMPAGNDYTIAEPDGYADIKAAQNFTLVDGGINAMFTGKLPFWTYRRVIDQGLFSDPNYAHDVATINVAANDYKAGIYPDDTNPGNNVAVLHAARQASLCYLYWLQTEAPRDDGLNKSGWPELMPSTTFFNTSDGISPYPYIRESRRIIPLVRVVQQNIDADYNPGPRATLFPDSCGIGNYAMDVHAGANGGPELEKATKPYQIPAGALVPRDCDNLLAAGKCLGVTHVTNGAYRLHPQEWNVGESAGALAAASIQVGQTPATVLATPASLIKYQNMLMDRGVPLFWWSDVLGNPYWKHIQMVGVHRIFQGDPGSLAFQPDDTFDANAQADVVAQLGQPVNWPATPITRAQAAEIVSIQMNWVV